MKNCADAKRIVIKIGTSTLAHQTGRLNIQRMERLVKVIADLKNAGKEIVLVSSGAIGIGAGKLGLPEKPQDLSGKQACAAVGQCELMYIYDKYFAEYNHTVAQVLLTLDVLNRDYVINTFTRLLAMNVLPIVNENDTVAVDEIVVGDNDTLSAMVCELIHGDLLVILSDIDGVYDDDPHKNPDAALIHEIPEVNDQIEALAKGAGSKLGTGGMATKIHAAKLGIQAGFATVIMSGQQPEQLYELFAGKQVGTRIGSGVIYCRWADLRKKLASSWPKQPMNSAQMCWQISATGC